MDAPLLQGAYYAEGINNYASHFHNSHEIIFVKKGHINADISDVNYDVKAWTLLFISNLERHSINVLSDEYERYCVQLSPVSARYAVKNNTLCSIFSNRPQGFVHSVNIEPIKDEIETVFLRLTSEKNSELPFSDEAQKSLLRLLLITLYRFSPESFPLKMTARNAIVEEIQKEFERNYVMSYTLEELAKKHHVSKSYLSHLFKDITGYGVMEYLSENRLSIAKDLLCTTNMSASKIAEDTGFSTSGNFSRYLKNDTGMTPKEYRNTHNYKLKDKLS